MNAVQVSSFTKTALRNVGSYQSFASIASHGNLQDLGHVSSLGSYTGSGTGLAGLIGSSHGSGTGLAGLVGVSKDGSGSGTGLAGLAGSVASMQEWAKQQAESREKSGGLKRSALSLVSLAESGGPFTRQMSAATMSEVLQELNETANRTTFIAIVVAMMGALMFGIDQGNYGLCAEFETFYDFWCKPHYMINGYSCDPGVSEGAETPQGWLTFKSLGGSLITLGAAAGCTSVGPYVSTRFGRQPCISLGGVLCFIGCLFASYFTFSNVTVYYAGRFGTGFGAGICCFALPLYSSEIATPGIRGLMGSLFQLMVVVGGVFASVALTFITDWRLGMILPGLAGLLVGVLIWITPESPRFVMDKYGYEAGVATLQKVRKGDVEFEARAMDIESEAEKLQGSVTFMELFSSPGRRRRVFIACYLQIAQQLTGVNAFLSYTTTVFEAAGIPKEQINSMPGYSIYFNILMLAGCIAGLCMIDSEYGGRRSQLLTATIIMGPPLLIAGFARILGWASWIPVAALALYGPGFQYAWGIIPWVYPSEIFSMNEKDKAVSLATFFVFLLNFVINMATPILLDYSSGLTFVLFGVLNVSNFLFVFLCIKETKGVPLDAIPALFEKPEEKRMALLEGQRGSY